MKCWQCHIYDVTIFLFFFSVCYAVLSCCLQHCFFPSVPEILWHVAGMLIVYFLVDVVNTLNTKTHTSKETAEFSLRNAEVKSICYCKQRMEGTLSLSWECVKTKLCKSCTSFISHLHSWCGMVWYRTLRAVHIFHMTPTRLVWNGVV